MKMAGPTDMSCLREGGGCEAVFRNIGKYGIENVSCVREGMSAQDRPEAVTRHDLQAVQ